MSSMETSTNDLARYTGTWVLDPEKTSITFRTRALWVVPVKGTARVLVGNAEVGAGGVVTGSLVIDATSFDTNNKKRDAHLQSEDFFEVAQFPRIVFTLTHARPAERSGFAVAGELDIRGRSQPLTLHAEVTGSDHSATVLTDFVIDRSQWGIVWATMGAGLKTRITINALFYRV